MDREDEANARSYELMPYGANAHAGAHPGRFAVLARLHGIDAPPIDGARVLELGCASGAHLAACAVAFPKTSFVGVDRTVAQIDRGREMLAEAGIGNVELRAMDIMDVGTTLGTFDYIIAHGLFSWVPERVQNEVLAICARSLAPHGIAYLSFNVYPGWHLRGVVRDALLFHLRDVDDPQARMTGARAFLAWWKARLVESGAYGSGIIRELETVENSADHYVLHDHLGVVNLPLHFRTFVERASASGLTYVCESEPRASALHGHLIPARDARGAAPDDRIAAEQYFDFLTNSAFRRSVFCRDENAVRTRPMLGAIDRMWVSSLAAPPAPGTDVRGEAPLVLRGQWGDASITDPTVKGALLHVTSAAPRGVPFSEMLDAARALRGVSSLAPAEVERLRTGVARLFFSLGLVDLHAEAPVCVATPGPKPKATAWARARAREWPRVPNIHLHPVELDEKTRQLLPLLDGTRERAALRKVVGDGADATLDELARAALLVE